MTDKKKLENEIDLLSAEISDARIRLHALDGLIKQFEKYPGVYENFSSFFYLYYDGLFKELIHGISRLQDETKNSLSVVKILERFKDENSEQSKLEASILKKIKESHINSKIKKLRNHYGIAHLDERYCLSYEELLKIHKQNKIDIKNVVSCLQVFTRALEIISCRLDIPLWLQPPQTSIRRELRELFIKLDGKSNNTDSI